jgi:hypothetical protein
MSSIGGSARSRASSGEGGAPTSFRVHFPLWNSMSSARPCSSPLSSSVSTLSSLPGTLMCVVVIVLSRTWTRRPWRTKPSLTSWISRSSTFCVCIVIVPETVTGPALTVSCAASMSKIASVWRVRPDIGVPRRLNVPGWLGFAGFDVHRR